MSFLRAVVLVGCCASLGMCPAPLRQAWQRAITEEIKPFQKLSQEDLEFSQSLFRRTLAASETGADFEKLAELWQVLGFNLESYSEAQQSFWLLRKVEHDRAGEGVFILRVGRPTETQQLLLQAPHSVTDYHTGDIVFELFSTSSAKAAAWNTRPRRTLCESGCTDLTHRDDSVFHVFTLAFASEFPRSLTVQIHGFSQSKRKTLAGREAEFIISSGSPQSSSLSKNLAETLAKRFEKDDVRLFGAAEAHRSVSELGATKNLQFQALQTFDYNGFLHIELSRELRQRLSDSVTSRNLLLASLKDAEEEIPQSVEEKG